MIMDTDRSEEMALGVFATESLTNILTDLSQKDFSYAITATFLDALIHLIFSLAPTRTMFEIARARDAILTSAGQRC